MTALSERFENWHGTAAEMAGVVTDILKELDLADRNVVPNERLVRNYVQHGILERPERQGKEAFFGFRQIVEFLVARSLIRDGWPLAKIGEFTRAADMRQLMDVLPVRQDKSKAKELVARFKRAAPRRHSGSQPEPAMAESTVLSLSAEVTKTRIAKRETLLALGNEEAAPKRDTMVRLTLAPWCQVYVDLDKLKKSPPETAELLGRALAQCLIDERVRPGDKK